MAGEDEKEEQMIRKSGVVEPQRFAGSSDSTCPAGAVVSFWFDRPYGMGGALCWAVADIDDAQHGTMRFIRWGKDYDGNMIEELCSVDEYYVDRAVPVDIVVMDSADVIPGCDQHGTDKWLQAADEMIEDLEYKCLGTYGEAGDWAFADVEVSDEGEIYLCDQHGYISRDEAEQRIAALYAYLGWWNSLEIDDKLYL